MIAEIPTIKQNRRHMNAENTHVESMSEVPVDERSEVTSHTKRSIVANPPNPKRVARLQVTRSFG